MPRSVGTFVPAGWVLIVFWFTVFFPVAVSTIVRSRNVPSSRNAVRRADVTCAPVPRICVSNLPSNSAICIEPFGGATCRCESSAYVYSSPARASTTGCDDA